MISEEDRFKQILDAAGAVGEVLDFYELDEFDAIYCLSTCMSALILGSKKGPRLQENMIHDISEILRTQLNKDHMPEFKGRDG